MSTRHRVYEIVELRLPDDGASRVFNVFMLSLISLNVVVLMAETVDPIYNWFPLGFDVFELVSVVIFSAEYVVRIWSCTAAAEYSDPVAGRLRYAATPLMVIDLLAVLPFYLPFVSADLRFLRSMRLVRLFRLAKLARYSRALQVLGRVFYGKKEELAVGVSLLALVLVFASSIMYYAERGAQAERFSSIPAAMWWAVATVTTVGYGDILTRA